MKMHTRQIVIEKENKELKFLNYECGFDYLNKELLSVLTDFIGKEGKIISVARIN